MNSIWLWSDTHWDHRPHDPVHIPLATTSQDTLIIAGDLATSVTLNLVTVHLCRLSQLYKHIVIVLGNHDYYGHGDGYDAAVKRWQQLTLPTNVFVATNDTVLDIGNTVFVLSTLWSAQLASADTLLKTLHDYKGIGGGWSPALAQEKHDEHVRFIDDSLTDLADTKKNVVVVTHHLPSFQCIDDKYKHNLGNAGFASHLDYLMKKHAETISLWCHGHTHMPCDMNINGVRVVCWPRAYPHEQSEALRPIRVLQRQPPDTGKNSSDLTSHIM
jgi:predicted phosphodiesterase